MSKLRVVALFSLGGVDAAVGFNDGSLAGGAGLRVAVFHANDAGVIFFLDVSHDVDVIDLAGAGLVARGGIAALQVVDLAPTYFA